MINLLYGDLGLSKMELATRFSTNEGIQKALDMVHGHRTSIPIIVVHYNFAIFMIILVNVIILDPWQFFIPKYHMFKTKNIRSMFFL